MSDETIVTQGALMLRWQVTSMVFVGIVLLMTIVFQSAGKVVGSFLLSIGRQGVIFLAVILIAYLRWDTGESSFPRRRQISSLPLAHASCSTSSSTRISGTRQRGWATPIPQNYRPCRRGRSPSQR
mgnify:CR=1 FL=1